MKFQNGTNQFTDPRFHQPGSVEGKFVDPAGHVKYTDGNFKPRLIENMKQEPIDNGYNSSIQNDTNNFHWQNRQNTLNKSVCDSTSNPAVSSTAHRSNGGFAVPLNPSEYRNLNKITTPDKCLSYITPAEYLLSRAGSYSDRPTSTATSLKSGFFDMPGSRNSGTFSHHSVRGKKRMLSISPISTDYLDLNEIIRTSPNSLVAFVNSNDLRSGFISRGSTGRNSSAASHASHSSYGHLSPAPMSQPVAPSSRQRNHFANNDTFNTQKQTFIQHPRRIPAPPPTTLRDVVSSSTGDLPPPNNFHHPPPSQQARKQTQQHTTSSSTTTAFPVKAKDEPLSPQQHQQHQHQHSPAKPDSNELSPSEVRYYYIAFVSTPQKY